MTYYTPRRNLQLELIIISYRFPLDPSRRSNWIANMHREDWQPSKQFRICPDHIRESCIDRSGKFVRLLPDAVPTCWTDVLNACLRPELKWYPWHVMGHHATFHAFCTWCFIKCYKLKSNLSPSPSGWSRHICNHGYVPNAEVGPEYVSEWGLLIDGSSIRRRPL